jgi:cytochrome c biogenesis protein CcdA/thiol-disulfide isomerase/thioredoxin
MILLMAFAFVAGAGTAITPCVLPVLPAILSASALGGRRRPLGIVLGLGITFTVAIVALSKVVSGVGLASGASRTFAIVVLLLFGTVMLIPSLAERVQAPLSRLARFGPRTRGTGFWTGLGVGAALGFVCAPCAGPILAAVISVSASTGGPTARVVLVAIAYVIGLSAVLLVYEFAGRAVLDRIRRALRGHVVEQVLGVVLVLTGVAMAFNYDVRFENLLAKHAGSLPAIFTDPTRSLESSHAVESRLASLRPASKFAARQAKADAADAADGSSGSSGSAGSAAQSVGWAISGVTTPKISDLGAAPNFRQTEDWFNTPGDRPLSLRSLRGHVVIVDFWTYTCINCIRTLPYLKGLYATYHRDGLEIVGVETPEFTFEQEASNVRDAIHADGIRYPIVQDNRYGTWDAYDNEYWPADYFIDAKGDVVHTQFGEGDYTQDEALVRELLYNAGHHHLPAPMTASAMMPSRGLDTPETYLNPQRSSLLQKLQLGTADYVDDKALTLNQFALNGTWTTTKQYITPADAQASVRGTFQAQHVYLVLTSVGDRPRKVKLLLNGRPITRSEEGADVHHSTVTVRGQRLYALLSLPDDEMGTLTVEVPHGVDAYDFTFG